MHYNKTVRVSHSRFATNFFFLAKKYDYGKRKMIDLNEIIVVILNDLLPLSGFRLHRICLVST